MNDEERDLLEGQRRREEELSAKAKLDAAEQVAELDGHDGWTALERHIRTQIQLAYHEIEQTRELDLRRLDQLIGTIRAYRIVADLPAAAQVSRNELLEDYEAIKSDNKTWADARLM